MASISLTHFVDFVSKAGTPKLTVVKNAKQQLANGYDPATDFYRAILDGIVEMHKGGQPKTALDSVMKGLSDKKKVTAYPPIVKGYKKFLGTKLVTWFEPPRDEWTHGGLAVSVNPELGLKIDGVQHVIKLYFKAEKLAKLRIDIATQLMDLVLGVSQKPLVFGVLDVRNSKLFTSSGVNEGLIALLQGEALSFAQIYASV
jgi:hypothetical protein